jgi:hypothetical protein
MKQVSLLFTSVIAMAKVELLLTLKYVVNIKEFYVTLVNIVVTQK